MTLPELKDVLTGISGFQDKVVFEAWPEGGAPALPFICFTTPYANPFYADGIVYYCSERAVVELYTKRKSIINEFKVQMALKQAGLAWTKESSYISSEDVYMTSYTLEV